MSTRSRNASARSCCMARAPCPGDASRPRRSRVLNTLLVMLFVFRLVFAPRRQGYTTTLSQLWAQCAALDVPLPQPQPVSDAAMCKARPKIDEDAFRQFHAAILRRSEQPGPLWLGHRVFAVDGSKLSLPRPLIDAGYDTPSAQAHYPQGLLSCLYQSRLPVDFDLCPHNNERTAALAHLKALQASDVIVYDRGYYSFELLCATPARRSPATKPTPSCRSCPAPRPCGTCPAAVFHFVS